MCVKYSTVFPSLALDESLFSTALKYIEGALKYIEVARHRCLFDSCLKKTCCWNRTFDFYVVLLDSVI